MTDKLRVVVADDHFLIRQGLRALLEQAGDLTVVGEARNQAEAIEVFLRQRPDVGIVDIRLGGGDGVQVIREI